MTSNLEASPSIASDRGTSPSPRWPRASVALRRTLLGASGLLMVLILASHAGDAVRIVSGGANAAAALSPDSTRGGTTRGAPVVLDPTPSRAWQALQASGLTDFERDRRAILAMAGTYRVSFEFMEVARFEPGERGVPYQSWGTEKVYVDRDTGRSLSLVHIMELHVQMEDGSISPPMVMKHWRQDWDYEPKQIVEYHGRDRWQRRAVDRREATGAWRQTVYQVDESPRYASLGHWQHSSSFSTWLSGETWRPLPRREWSVREDYQVLIGTNRHTVMPTGWLQEENNLKGALTPGRTLRAAQPYVARVRDGPLRAHPGGGFRGGGQVLRRHEGVLGRGV